MSKEVEINFYKIFFFNISQTFFKKLANIPTIYSCHNQKQITER